MYKSKNIAVVVPAFNEEKLIFKVLSSVPDFVDILVVVDDKSTDLTAKVVKDFLKRPVVLIEHEENQGVGGAIESGYRKAFSLGADIAVVMAGDAQMDPRDIDNLLEPLINNKADYVKGNRLSLKLFINNGMPKVRLIGNILLTLITKISSGYWNLVDSQCGYTAISRKAFRRIEHDKLYKRYGFPNDILAKLNVYDLRVKDVRVKSIYGEAESGINIFSFAFNVSILLLRLFVWRIWKKYLFKKPIFVE
jgi:glycosyltransferase involved in cell wall biosynthesis